MKTVFKYTHFLFNDSNENFVFSHNSFLIFDEERSAITAIFPDNAKNMQVKTFELLNATFNSFLESCKKNLTQIKSGTQEEQMCIDLLKKFIDKEKNKKNKKNTKKKSFANIKLANSYEITNVDENVIHVNFQKK